MSTRIVGLCGYAGVGKDAICTALGWKRTAFADALKSHIDPLFPEGTPKETKRPVYVAYGRAMRTLDPNYWISCLSLLQAPEICIADVRYVNEAKFILGLGGVVVRLHRKGVVPANEEEHVSIFQVCAELTGRVVHYRNDDTPAAGAAYVLSLFEKFR